jgi:hypothetical protein
VEVPTDTVVSVTCVPTQWMSTARGKTAELGGHLRRRITTQGTDDEASTEVECLEGAGTGEVRRRIGRQARGSGCGAQG